MTEQNAPATQEPTQQEVFVEAPINPMATLTAMYFGDAEAKALIEKQNAEGAPVSQAAAAKENIKDANPPAKEPAKAAANPAAESGTTTLDSELFDVKEVKSDAPGKTYKTIDELKAAYKEKFGIEDPEKLLEVGTKWRGDSAKLGELQKNYDKITNWYKSIPTEYRNLLNAYSQGQDVRPFIQQLTSLDYSKTFEQHDIKTLLKEVAPSINTSDKELDDYIDVTDLRDPAVKATLELAKERYNNKQAAIQREREGMTKSQEAYSTSVLSSISTSVENLTSTYKKIAQEKVKNINDILSSDDVEGKLLTDNKGLYLPDAAERVYFALHGKDELKKIYDAYAKLKDEYEQVLSKGTDKPNEKRGTQDAVKQETNPVAAKFLQKQPNPWQAKSSIPS